MSSLFVFLLEHDCNVTIIFNCIVFVESLCHTSFNLSKDLDFNIEWLFITCPITVQSVEQGTSTFSCYKLRSNNYYLIHLFKKKKICTVLPKSTIYQAGLLFYSHLRTAHHAKRLLSERYARRLTQCVPLMEGCNVSHCIGIKWITLPIAQHSLGDWSCMAMSSVYAGTFFLAYTQSIHH